MTLKEKLERKFFLIKILNVIFYLFFKSIRLVRKNNQAVTQIIAVIALHKLGDSVFIIPALKSIIEKHTKEIVIICYKESELIFKRVVNGVKYINIEKSELLWNGRIVSKKARKILQKLNPEIIIDLTGTILSASLIFNINAKKIIGINEYYYRGIYDDYNPIRKTPHQIDLYFDAIKNFCKPNKLAFNGYPVNLNIEGIILIQPFAGWNAKEWNLKKFIQLYKNLSANYKCYFILAKSSLKEDILTQMLEENIDIIESNGIDHLMDRFTDCRLFISNDSGPLQIAALFGIPTFCIYGPTNPKFHLPYGKYHRFVQKKIKCSPDKEKYCFTLGGRYCPHYDCLALLTEDEVFTEVSKMLSELKIVS